MGYVLYAGDPADELIVGIRFKEDNKELASSYLGELRGYVGR